MIRAVIDTNVLVSGLRKPLGNEGRILQAVRWGPHHPCVSLAIVREYEDVLARRKFQFPASVIVAILALIRDHGGFYEATPRPVDGPDPGDFMFMRCAMASQADYLVTGNRRHFTAPSYGSALVVNAREFLDFVKPPT